MLQGLSLPERAESKGKFNGIITTLLQVYSKETNIQFDIIPDETEGERIVRESELIEDSVIAMHTLSLHFCQS